MGCPIAIWVGVHAEVSRIVATLLTARGTVRYQYKHSILGYAESEWDGKPLVPGHRVSFMVRVSLLVRSSPRSL